MPDTGFDQEMTPVLRGQSARILRDGFGGRGQGLITVAKTIKLAPAKPAEALPPTAEPVPQDSR